MGVSLHSFIFANFDLTFDIDNPQSKKIQYLAEGRKYKRGH
jgi:hypothetical protein